MIRNETAIGAVLCAKVLVEKDIAVVASPGSIIEHHDSAYLRSTCRFDFGIQAVMIDDQQVGSAGLQCLQEVGFIGTTEVNNAMPAAAKRRHDFSCPGLADKDAPPTAVGQRVG